MVLKLKTADFRIISRHVTPPQPPISLEQFTALAIGLLSRVEHPPGQRYRLVGVGLDGVESGDSGVGSSQADLFLAGGDRS